MNEIKEDDYPVQGKVNNKLLEKNNPIGELMQRLLCSQLGLGLVVSIILTYFLGFRLGLSVLVGGGISWVGSLWVSYIFFHPAFRSSPRQAVNAFFVAGLSKLFLVGVLWYIALQYLKLHFLGLAIGFIVTQSAYKYLLNLLKIRRLA